MARDFAQPFALGVTFGIVLGAAVTYQWRPPKGVPAAEHQALQVELLGTTQDLSLAREAVRDCQAEVESLRAELAKAKGETAEELPATRTQAND